MIQVDEKRIFVTGIELFDTISMIIPVNPMGAVRTTRGMIKRIKFRLYEQGDKKVERVIAYLQYKEIVGLIARAEMGPRLPMTGPIHTVIHFFMPIPPSKSRAQQLRLADKLHVNKPDRDNLEKGVFDSCNKIIFEDDKQLCSGYSIKRYSQNPRIELFVSRIREG